MQLAAVTNDDVVVDHNPGMNDAVGTDTASLADADPRTNSTAGTDHGTLIDHRRGMNLRQGPPAGMQLIERFGKSQTGVSEDREGNAALGCEINQILLVRQQQGADVAFTKRSRESVALFQKAELSGCGLVERGGTFKPGIRSRLTPTQACITGLQNLGQGAETHGSGEIRADRRRG